MKALLVDDERLARIELKRLLEAFPEIKVVGEAANAEEAELLIGSLEPDLLFLDVQMPGRNGFELLAGLEKAPAVIFVTAFDDYALRAFEVSAVDYLMKPVVPERLAAAVRRLATAPAEASESPGARLSTDQPVFLRDGEKCWFVKLAEVTLFESEGNYTRVCFRGNRPLILRSLASLEARLDPGRFFRASRKHILNLQAIEAIHPAVDGGYEVTMKGGLQVEMSRRRAADFRERMSL